MRLFWWQHLPLLILIQFLEPFRCTHKLQAEALVAFKSTVGNSLQLAGRIRRYPCFGKQECIYRHKPENLGVVSWFSRFYPLSPQIRKINLSPSTPPLSLLRGPSGLQENFYGSRKTTIAATIDGNDNVPTLTPLQGSDVKKPSKQKLAAIIGGVGAALLVVITGVVVYFCLMRLKRLIRRESDAASSVPSPPVVWERENISPGAGAGTVSPYDTYNLRQLSILELEQATGNFNEINIIGEGSFGLVYKGLLDDGSIVAIKRRLHYPVQYFANEVKQIACVHHKHLVKLIGYCEENRQQFLVYDYLPNGDIGNHLYDSEGLPIGKLEMRQRLIIALAAAKGLEHLHCLSPPILHLHFRTRNVLVDDNYTGKVSDFGLSKLLVAGYHAESSSAFDCFRDPEVRWLEDFSERSDVYSFGVFLLELISGREALGRNQSDTQGNLVLQAKGTCDLDNFVDKTVRDHASQAVKQMSELALLCVDTGTRPSMKSVVEELERIQEGEIRHLHSGLGEEIGIVTLGSDLFK
ncbi:probable serine/threonine-protein kinase PBL28 isoform X2 [Actinidia eriantha]|uniref:probable serine/threonine-protein kinase PBL28 isoform X2 n=1 Tax=Actinidia eriantha TaxID=165200 RepID=UPI00258FDAE8|nr:probable serine/threonine-protein kinase PBL28 isoform X2 [Actinidia eriantha]